MTFDPYRIAAAREEYPMSDLEELKARIEAAKARATTAALSPEETEHAKLLAEVAEAEAEARIAETARRALRGATEEATARKAAGSRYLVKYFDLAALVPDFPAEQLPGAGVLVLRSPPPNATAQFHREVEAKEKPLVDCYIDLDCASVVYPDMTGKEGMLFRDFLEGGIGYGTAIQIGDAATTLGGARAKATKRGRG